MINECDLEKSYLEQSQSYSKHNITKDEFAANESLKRNKDIVIKKANKGSNVVIQNCKDYINEGLRQLSDRYFYRLQEESLTEIHNTLIKQAIDNMPFSKEISSKTADYLYIDYPRTAKLNLLPKIP